MPLLAGLMPDLANDLGIIHRTLSMIERFQGGKLLQGRTEEAVDASLRRLTENTGADYRIAMEKMDLTEALKCVWALIGRSNKYIDETAPWALAKKPEQADRSCGGLVPFGGDASDGGSWIASLPAAYGAAHLVPTGLDLGLGFCLHDGYGLGRTAGGNADRGGGTVVPSY